MSAWWIWLRQRQRRHPRLMTWAILSVGMVALFLGLSADSGLTVGQTIGLAAMCILLAGACTAIIDWE